MKTTLFTLALSLLVSASAFAVPGKSVFIEGAEAKRVYAAAEALGATPKSGLIEVGGVYCAVTTDGKTQAYSCSVAGAPSITDSRAQDMVEALRAASISVGKPVQEQTGKTVADVSLQGLKCIRQELVDSDVAPKKTRVDYFCSATL